MFFAGIWVKDWTSVRKIKEGLVTLDLYAFLTTEPNGIVAPVHQKAMPVLLTRKDEVQTWLTAPWSEAHVLQRPLPEQKLKIVQVVENLAPANTLKKWIAGFTAALVCCHPSVAAEPLIGRASVIDGDTIEIAGKRVRLRGVDAPENWQKCEDGDGGTYRCGKEAAVALDRFLAASRPTRCDVVARDRYKRVVGVCFRADGVEVNRWLVASGYAVDWARYSGGSYAAAQDRAQASGVGVVSSNCLARRVQSALSENLPADHEGPVLTVEIPQNQKTLVLGCVCAYAHARF